MKPMLNPERYLITSALPYANGPLHIGHLSGAYLPADVFARYLRLYGKTVLYVCGSDEHGAAITMRALKEGISPQEIIDKYHASFKKAFSAMNFSFDIYHRTSSKLHHETSQEFFKNLYDNGELIEKTSEQYYDTVHNQFLADRYIMGTCPKCGNEEAYGDQCEKCGSTLSPEELIDPKSKLSGEKPSLKKTSHWYLPLDKHEAWLKEWIEKGTLDGVEHHDPKTWKKHVIGQCKSWLDTGLAPRAMTRDLDWGIDVPKEIPGSEGKKLYVWMDAPIGYISATKAWAIAHEKELENGRDEWKKYWQDDQSSINHFIGKDNIVFHCLTFPSILKAAKNYSLPQNVPANQFMNLEGRKISTSKNWAVWVNEFVEDLPEYTDVLRYYAIKYSPEQKDSEFTWQGFQDANNNELVNNLANFINRILVLINKYYDGEIPTPDEDVPFIDPVYKDDHTFLDAELLRLYDYTYEVHEHIMKFEFRAALQTLMEISSFGNQLIQNNEPWKLVKEDPEATKNVLFLGAQIVYSLAYLMQPFMPSKSADLLSMLDIKATADKDQILTMMNDLAEGLFLIQAGHKLGKVGHLFNRIPDELIQIQKDKLEQSAKVVNEENPVTTDAVNSNSFEAVKSNIEFDTFQQLDLRAGVITEAEKIKKADKLLKLTVDLGFEVRTIVSGIAEHYTTENVIGQKITLVANLAPRKLRGVESQGMILMSEDASGKLLFVNPGMEAVNGSAVK